MTWMDPHPDTVAEFSNAFYDALDAEQAEADALADRLADHTAHNFTASLSPPGGEARSLTTAGSGPDATPPYPLGPRRGCPSSTTGRAA